MKASKLVQILATFSPVDWKQLHKMVTSPVYCSAKEAPLMAYFLKIIQKALQNDKLEEWTKTKMGQTLFPEMEPKRAQATLAKLMTRCNKLVEALLLDDPITTHQRYLLLAKALQERGLDEMAARQLEKAARNLEHPQRQEKEYYQHYTELADAWTSYYSTRDPAKVGQYLQQSEYHLDEWYLLAKLEQVVWQEAQRIQMNTPSSTSWLPIDNLLTPAALKQLVNYPVHSLYYSALSFLRPYPNATDEDFQELAHQLETKGDLLDENKRKALQTLLRIYAAGRYNRGNKAYLPIAMKLYEAHLAAGYLYFDNKLHSQTLLNLVTLGVRSERFAWVDTLLAQHKNRILDQSVTAQALGVCRALYFFYQKNYSAALEHLADSYDNLYFRLAARRLEIMIYAEQQSVLLSSKLEAFKVYIYRLSQKQLPEKPKALNNNFVDMLRQITHPSTLGNEKRIARLREKIKQTTLLAERDWLMSYL